ncbi:MAG: site-2 protease family protein [Methanobacterium sp.]|nr:site-2 protease family protein [Methanobacterium sp.]
MDDFTLIEQSISNHFPLIGFHKGGEGKESYFIVGNYRPESFQELARELDKNGFIPFINPEGYNYKINIAKKPEKGESRIIFNIILFMATICTTLFAGYVLGKGDIWQAIAFSASLLGIIGAHETAHYLAARKHGVNATLPYFIPAPTIIGTFGALINVKSPIPNRKALFDLGYSGPLAGFLVAIPIILIGLNLSTLGANTDTSMLFLPPPIMELLTFLTAPTATGDQILLLHPVAFAGWVGIIVTMLNLMPVAYLDGGHIVRSLFGPNFHKIVSIVGVVITSILGWYFMALLMLFIFFIGKGHPGAQDNISSLDRKRKIIAVLIMIIFILCLSPAPINL